MSKYQPLTNHLAARNLQKVPMRFDEIEQILGCALPPSARKHRAWWSNNPSNSVMTKAWLDAGYQSEQVDLQSERLVFARLNTVDTTPPHGGHPLVGCMKGTFTITPGDDLTEPTSPDWDNQVLAKFDRLMAPQS